MKNTSQDPDYEGPTYHERRFHKTHFSVPDKGWEGSAANWVEIRPGRWRLEQKRAGAGEEPEDKRT